MINAPQPREQFVITTSVSCTLVGFISKVIGYDESTRCWIILPEWQDAVLVRGGKTPNNIEATTVHISEYKGYGAMSDIKWQMYNGK